MENQSSKKPDLEKPNGKNKFNLIFFISLIGYLISVLLHNPLFHEFSGSLLDVLANITSFLLKIVSIIIIILISGIYAYKATGKKNYFLVSLLQMFIIGQVGIFLAFVVGFFTIKFLEKQPKEI